MVYLVFRNGRKEVFNKIFHKFNTINVLMKILFILFLYFKDIIF